MRFPVLITLILLAACGRTPPPEPQNQSIRPARLFRVSAIDNMAKHTFVGGWKQHRQLICRFKFQVSSQNARYLKGKESKRDHWWQHSIPATTNWHYAKPRSR